MESNICSDQFVNRHLEKLLLKPGQVDLLTAALYLSVQGINPCVYGCFYKARDIVDWLDCLERPGWFD